MTYDEYTGMALYDPEVVWGNLRELANLCSEQGFYLKVDRSADDWINKLLVFNIGFSFSISATIDRAEDWTLLVRRHNNSENRIEDFNAEYWFKPIEISAIKSEGLHTSLQPYELLEGITFKIKGAESIVIKTGANIGLLSYTGPGASPRDKPTTLDDRSDCVEETLIKS